MQPEAQAALRRVWLKQELIRHRQRSEAQPDNIEVWRQIGRACWELGEAEAALQALEKVLALQSDDGECLLGKAVACLALKRNAEALEASVRLLALFPGHPQALMHQCEALRRLGRLAEAVAVGEKTLTLPLSSVQRLDVLRDQATLLFQLNRLEESLATMEQALTLAPDDAYFQLNKARLLHQSRRFTEALDVVETVITTSEKAPVNAQCLKAWILAALWRFDDADALLQDLQERYSHAILEREFEPWRLPDEAPEDSLQKRYTGRGLYMAQVFQAQQECDWTDWETMLAHVDDLTGDVLQYGFVAGLEAHRLLSLPIAPALQLAVARAQATAVDKLMTPIRQQLPIQWSPRQLGQRLRVGYVSGDFRDHPTAHLIRKLFQAHDREQFEVFGYSLRPGDGSRYWRDISQACDQFVELHGVSNADAATRIAADRVQILVDLHGYTRFARPEIFALRPAPVQISFLGYPGTLGADCIAMQIN
ncbi:MAG TPA: tetratricopeptide repeat protein, partial [Candidatus Competibacteraceae bacterium]|nr:tetratricopeptide repeat protein [Candidatus Competibacteraceae bacterium]